MARTFLFAALLALSGSAAASSGPILLDKPAAWTGAYYGITKPMDWSGYDFVEVTLFNPGNDVMPFTFEVKDALSTSYWTRVNQPGVVGPGLQRVKLPTRIKVGEPARPGRSLEVSKVVSLILSREDKYRQPIEIRKIELKKSEPWPMPPGARAFDVGPEDTPVFDGLEAITEKTDYTSTRGFGWTDKKLWAPYSQVNRLFGPEHLTGDNLTPTSGRIRIDLKPGQYRVALIIDHPGGFWGEFPRYAHRIVRAQGTAVIDERESPAEAEKRYFKWEDREDREGDDLFERYWNEILKEKSFATEVAPGGHLELSFENVGCASECFGLALSFLAVFPYDTPEQRLAASKWLAELHEKRRAEFHDEFKQTAHRITDLLAALPQGLSVRDVPSTLDLSLASPKDAHSFGAKANLTTFRNARAHFAPVIAWKGKTPRTISWRVEGLPESLPLEGGWIRFRALRDNYTGNQYSIRERWATDETERVFAAEDVGRLWLRVPVPSSAKPGTYPATLVLSTGRKGEEARVPFEVHVLKGVAADLDFPVGPFYLGVREDWADPKTLKSRLASLEGKSLEKLASLGMTSFSFKPRIGVSVRGDRVELDTREVDRIMSAARKLGFQGVVGYDEIFAGSGPCAANSSLFSDPARLRAVATELEERAIDSNWLPFALIVCDEPPASDLPKLITKLEKADLGRGRKVQWGVTTSLGKEADPLDRKLVSLVGMPFLQGFAKDDLRFPWAYYNDPSRSSVGLRMFDLRESSDLRYRMIWAWNVNSANPYFSLDGREDDIAWCSSLMDGDLQCTVELDRVYDAGVTDYRIALALKHALATRTALAPALKAEGQKLLGEARDEHVDPDKWRAKVGELLERL
jgi:hypothetical protein